MVCTPRRSEAAGNDAALLAAIVTFLTDQRLRPDPTNYAFAYKLVTEPDSALARAVAELTDGGIRLTGAQVAELGGNAQLRGEGDEARAARTRVQIAGFADMMQAMHDETAGFGRDLAASADAMRASRLESPTTALDRIEALTGAMLARVDHAESRLAQATREAHRLRTELEEARGDARRDSLTALPNRRALEEAFTDVAAPAFLGLCDVDHFKSVNDRFGHDVGDRVLKAIAATLSQNDGGHFVARHGGEEFAILFVNTSPADARACVEAMQAAVRDRRFRLRETDADIGRISFSAGLAPIVPGEAFVDACRRADALLYRAKQAGRDRIVCEECE